MTRPVGSTRSPAWRTRMVPSPKRSPSWKARSRSGSANRVMGHLADRPAAAADAAPRSLRLQPLQARLPVAQVVGPPAADALRPVVAALALSRVGIIGPVVGAVVGLDEAP